jgi:hypothetical protein
MTPCTSFTKHWRNKTSYSMNKASCANRAQVQQNRRTALLLTACAQCISDRTGTLLSEGEELGRNPIKNQSQKTDPKQNKKRDRKSSGSLEIPYPKNHVDVKAGILDQTRQRPHRHERRPSQASGYFLSGLSKESFVLELADVLGTCLD